jgi:hypothetical protein
MNIREIATSRLKEYENNPRNNDLAVEKVKYSIERFGFLVPVIVDVNFVIVAGHTRVRACRELGIQSVPCIVADELTEEQVNFFRLVDNKTSEYSDWDFEKLKEELSLIDLTLEENQLLLERFDLSAEVFDIETEQAEIKISAFNFMSGNDMPKEKKPTVRTIQEDDSDEVEEDVDSPVAVRNNSSEDHKTNAVELTSEEISDEVIEADTNVLTESEGEIIAEVKKSKGMLPFFQFRFGNVAFYISQVELDRLNAAYAEFIDTGAILSGSFANYLLKGIEANA